MLRDKLGIFQYLRFPILQYFFYCIITWTLNNVAINISHILLNQVIQSLIKIRPFNDYLFSSPPYPFSSCPFCFVYSIIPPRYFEQDSIPVNLFHLKSIQFSNSINVCNIITIYQAIIETVTQYFIV